MGQGRPSGASYGAASARIDLDLTALTAAPRVAQTAGEATAKALQQSLKIVQNEQKIAIANAQQALAAMRGQQQQATATTRAESQERIQQARAEATSVIEQERRKTAAFKQEIKERNKSQVSGSSFGQNAASFAGAAVGGPLGGLIGAATMGNPALAAGLAVGQAARFAVDAAQLATAYNRQNVAAVQLAGSQSKLNSYMAVYDKATGGIVNKSDELANVTKLMAVGFADSTSELDQFARAIRGISIAMGTSADTVTQNLILELFSQRGMRLDQLGLEYEKVRQRSEELQAADGTLTKQMAYQQAVIEQATDRYGKLADSAEGAGTGIEKLSKAWADFQLKVGQADKGAVVGLFSGAAAVVNQASNSIDLQELLGRRAALRGTGSGLFSGKFDTYAFRNPVSISDSQADFVLGRSSSDAGRHRGRGAGISGAINPNAGEIRQVHLDWAQGIQELNTQTHAAILDEETSFGASRAKTVADYNRSVARDEASYARSRLRANLDFLDSMADAAKDAARREAGMAADLARTMATAREEGSEKAADIRKDSAKRLKEIDESYAEDREKAAKSHTKNLRDAARDLNAKAVADEQHSFAEQEADAKKAHDKAVKENGEQLQERLDDEAKSLAKSLKQQQDAYDRQLAEGRENDRLKLEDMKAAFAKQQERQAEDHAEQVRQRAEDQAAQLVELDTQHNLRLEQIANHAAADRKALDEEAKADLLALGVRNDAWQKLADAKELAQEKLWDKFMEHVNGTLKEGRPNTPQISQYASGGWVQRSGPAQVHAGEFMLSGGMLAGNQPIPVAVRNAVGGGSSRSITVGDIHLHGVATDSPGDFAQMFNVEMKKHMEAWIT